MAFNNERASYYFFGLINKGFLKNNEEVINKKSLKLF
jgi:hypothetical protein